MDGNNNVLAKENIPRDITEDKIMAWKDIKVNIKIEYYFDKLDTNTPDRVIKLTKDSYSRPEVLLELDNERQRVVDDVNSILKKLKEKSNVINFSVDESSAIKQSSSEGLYKEDNGYSKINTPKGLSGNSKPTVNNLEEKKAS